MQFSVPSWEAQQQLPELSEQLTDEPAIVTKEGKPVMITFNIEQFESLMETIEIVSDKKLIEDLQQGIKEIEFSTIFSELIVD